MITSLKKKGFTLMELVLAIIVFSILLSIVLGIYSHLIKVKTSLDARALVINTTYDIVEKLNTTLENHTIDYEEYFNRGLVGCDTIRTAIEENNSDFKWNTSATTDNGYCDNYTHYGNGMYKVPNSNYSSSSGEFARYWCSSIYQEGIFLPNANPDETEETNVIISLPGYPMRCYSPFLSDFTTRRTIGEFFWQPYGTYASHFVDVKDDVDDKPTMVGDDDDVDVGRGPIGIDDHSNIKELYLISKDKKTRIFIRRALKATEDVNKDGIISLPQEKHYVLQMLQLKAFDAGQKHDFNSDGVYDGVIDTWACDAGAGFICSGPSIGGIYTEYRMPSGANDGWVNLTADEVTVTDWNMQITPIKDPLLARDEAEYQKNPFITLNISTAIYGKGWWNKVGGGVMANIDYELQTSFNIKTNY